MTIKEARVAAGLSQASMSELLEIPKRTIEDWERGKSKPAPYVEKLVIEKLINIKENKTMKVYELKKFTAEIKRREDVRPGCALEDSDPETIAKYDSLEEAKATLSSMPTATATYRGWAVPFWYVEEYAVEIYEADEDGEFLDGSDYETQDTIEFM